MSQPVSAQPGGPNSGLITHSLPQWQQVAVQFGGSNSGLIHSSLPQLQAHVPQPVPAQLGVSLNSERIPPSLQQWQPVAAQSGGSNSGLIPPSLTQWQASVSQSVPAQYGLGGSNSGLNPSQSQWQAPPSFDSQPHFSLPNTHNSESPISSFQANITENLNRVKSIRTSHKRDSQRFTAFGDTKRARPTGTRVASNIEPLVILPGVIKNLKELAHKDMVRRVFEIGLFPTPDEMTVTANAALDTVIGSDGNYFLPTPCCMTYQRRNSKP
jgi:hypothetical protein